MWLEPMIWPPRELKRSAQSPAKRETQSSKGVASRLRLEVTREAEPPQINNAQVSFLCSLRLESPTEVVNISSIVFQFYPKTHLSIKAKLFHHDSMRATRTDEKTFEVSPSRQLLRQFSHNTKSPLFGSSTKRAVCA